MARFKTFLTAAAALMLSTGMAYANVGSFSVNVWYGSGVTDNAALSNLPGSAPNTANFTYTGPIDFVNNNPNGGSNTFGDFFGSLASNISGYSGTQTLANFLAATMSTPGLTYNSYLEFTGTYSAAAGTILSISHDDGAGFYAGSPLTQAFTTTTAPTSEITESGLLPVGTNIPFALTYVEANGSPADLVAQVPEPGSLALLGFALLGFGLIRRRVA